jgi:excisionase family DNA binding protein
MATGQTVIKRLSRAEQAERDSLFMTVQEAAAHMRVSPSYLWKAIAKKKGPPTYRVGRLLRIHRDELVVWMKKGSE